MKKQANIGHSNKIQRKIFAIKLKHTLKKCSIAELQIIIIQTNLELKRRINK